jgi:hypothetical protein
MCTAEMIFPLEDAALIGERLIAGQKLQTALAEIIAGHHGRVIDDERRKMEDAEHFHNPLDAADYVDHVVADVAKAAKGTPWEQHFADPEVQAAIHEVVAQHVRSVQHAERLWHAAHNESEPSKQYFAKYHG